MSSPGIEPGLRPSRSRVRIRHTPRTFFRVLVPSPARESDPALRLRRPPCVRHTRGEIRHTPIRHGEPERCPCQESNLVCDLRRVACGSVTLQGPVLRSSTDSRDARIRTLSASFGDSLLSQEHIPIKTKDSGYSAGVEPVASRFTFSRASVTPRTPSDRSSRSFHERLKRKGRESNPQGSSLARIPGGSRRRSGGPSVSDDRYPNRPNGPGWTRTTDLPHVKGTSWPLNDGT
jgi:hypothetical protein